MAQVIGGGLYLQSCGARGQMADNGQQRHDDESDDHGGAVLIFHMMQGRFHGYLS